MIGATLSHADAAGRHWQFIVVGAGPGGSATALRLARAGRSVLLVDRGDMPRAKVCGCCLSATALHELAALDVFSGDDPSPVPLAAVRIVAGGRAARVPLGGATLSREALDTILVERAVEAGVHWLPEFLVTSLADAVDGVCLTGRAVGAEPTLSIACDHAVIAAGLADHVRIDACIDPTAPQATADNQPLRSQRAVAAASRIGLGATLPAAASDLPAGELVMAVGRGGYAGIVRLEDGRIDIAAAIDRATIAATGRPADAIVALLAEALDGSGVRVSSAALHAADMRATPPLTHRSPLVAGVHTRIFRIGDAAGYVEPFTGEGMGWALANARIFAAAALAADRPHVMADRYRSGHDRLFSAHHARCRGVARAVRHPWLVSGAVRLARLAPWIAAPVVSLLVGASARRRRSG